MPWKMEGDTVALVEHEGKKLPVFVYPDGKESPFDGDTTIANIGKLNGEAKGHREAKEAAEKRLKAFEGIEDPEVARKALETVKNLDDVVKNKVDDVARTYESKFAKEKEGLQATIDKEVSEKLTFKKQRDTTMVTNAFTASKFIRDTSAVPADVVQALFGRHITVDDAGSMIAVDNEGHQIRSRVNPTNVAPFEEAISILWDSYPNKDSITKGSGASGGGASNNGGGGNSSTKTITRANFDRLNPTEKADKMRNGWKVEG